jgi:predicted transcriptional regulator
VRGGDESCGDGRLRSSSKAQRARPETESRLQELASKSDHPPSDLIEDAMAGYLQELSEVRTMLDGRYDDLKSGSDQNM